MTVWTQGATAAGGLVSGIGDAGFWGPAIDATPTILGFRQGGRAVRILVGSGGVKTMDGEKLQRLARLISQRMEQ